MRISKALVVADPWIGYILDGSKTWEMRASGTAHRGWFGLIRKGAGAIYGIARLVDVRAPLTPTQMIQTMDRHRIPSDLIASGQVTRWNTPWVLADVRRLDEPVPYRHPSGAVTWVTLDDDVALEIADRSIGLSTERQPSKERPAQIPIVNGPTTSRSRTPDPQPKGSSAKTNEEIRIEINEANLRNKHFYLRDHVHKFPDDVIGGSNKSKLAKRTVRLDWGGAVPVETDIDGEDKKLFRARGWIGAFFKLTGAAPGDVVVLEQVEPYRYRVTLRKR